MDRTIVTQLHPTPEQARIFSRTLDEHTACFNAVCQEGFRLRLHWLLPSARNLRKKYSNGVELHKETYSPLRAQYPDLPAQLVCAARVKATEAVKSALTWAKKHEATYPKKVEKARPILVFKPVTAPHSTIAPIRYDARSRLGSSGSP